MAWEQALTRDLFTEEMRRTHMLAFNLDGLLRGDIESRFSRDWLLTLVTLFWVTGTITSSTRDYFDNRWHGITIGPKDFVTVPTGIANFARQFVFEGEPPREWAERLYDIRRWTTMPTGGHFAPAEDPETVSHDIATFFGDL